MTSNYSILKDFLDFSDPGKFYLALVVKRKKDNPEMDRSEQIIKNYMISSYDKLERILPEMETLCNTFNARIYLYINRRSFKNTQKAMLKTLCDQICSESVSSLNHLFDSCAASSGCGDKWWIIDVDSKMDTGILSRQDEIKTAISERLNNVEPKSTDSKVGIVIPSKNGLHILSRPFDTRQWSKIKTEIEDAFQDSIELELKKDAMVNLIYPSRDDKYKIVGSYKTTAR